MKRASHPALAPSASPARNGATSEPTNAFGERLRALRLDRMVNQRDLAAQVGIDFTYLSKLENGRMAPPAADTIVRLSGALEADPDELLLLARKVPRDIHPMITRSIALPAFLRSISDLSDDELQELSSYAHQVRAKRK